MVNLKSTFNVEIGLSDHTLGIVAPVVSVALGAKVIEKHFVLSKSIGGPDASFSLEPSEFALMVKSVRQAELAIGKVDYSVDEKKRKNRMLARSLFVTEKIQKGDIFTLDNIKSIRPGNGLHPKYIKSIIGKKADCDISRGTPLDWNLIK